MSIISLWSVIMVAMWHNIGPTLFSQPPTNKLYFSTKEIIFALTTRSSSILTKTGNDQLCFVDLDLSDAKWT